LWLIRSLDDRRLPLKAADGRPRHVYAHFVGDLQLYFVIVEARDLPVDAAGRDDLVVHLQALEKLLHLLLLALHREKDDEVEDAQHQHERYQLEPGASAIRRGAKCEHGNDRDHHGSWGWRDKLWWSPNLKLSNRPNAIASLIRRRVSR